MPEIQECLICALWARLASWDFCMECSPQVILVAEIQTKIGWINFTDGKLAKELQILQQRHYKQSNSDMSAQKWARGLVMEILHLTHSQ